MRLDVVVTANAVVSRIFVLQVRKTSYTALISLVQDGFISHGNIDSCMIHQVASYHTVILIAA